MAICDHEVHRAPGQSLLGIGARRLRTWLLDSAPTSVVLTLAFLLGATLGFHTLGADYIFGTSPYWIWPAGDAAMMVTGWHYFIHDTWHFPLAHTTLRAPPEGTNILFLDSIPLVAALAKLLRPIVGTNFQPYSLWHFALYVLQSLFATLAARRVGVRSCVGGLAVSVLALSTHAFLLRFYHLGLNGHFVLLWALWTYLRAKGSRRTWTLALEISSCTVIAILLHPYLGAMVVAILSAAMLERTAIRLRASAVVGSVAAATIGLALFAFDYIPQTIPLSAGDFGRSSTNLISFVIPFYSTLLPWLSAFGRLASTQDATGIQWDGSNFLGIGLWILLPVLLVSSRRTLAAAIASHKALTFTLCLFALYAPANRWFFGQFLLLSYEIPKQALPLADAFRATGRFFWPVSYALILAAAALVTRRFGRKGTIFLGSVATLQLFDATACMTVVRDALAKPVARELDWDEWELKLARVSRVSTFPSYTCWGSTQVEERVMQQQREIEFLASRRGVTTNGGRSGRPLVDCAREQEEASAAMQSMLRPNELYVFFLPRYSHEELRATMSLANCTQSSDSIACESK